MPLFENSRIQPEVLKDKVVETLRDAILAGDLRSGERLIEGHLIKQLGVSRAPLRDALWQLEKQGYVRMVPHKGTYVISLSVQEIEEIYDVRAVLEGHAAGLAKQRIRPQDVKELRKFLKARQNALSQGDLPAIFNNDLMFHQYIWTLSGNRKLEKVLQNICPGLFTYLLVKYQSHTSYMEKGLSTHEEIVSLLESDKSPEEVERLVRLHISDLSKVSTRLLGRSDSQPD